MPTADPAPFSTVLTGRQHAFLCVLLRAGQVRNGTHRDGRILKITTGRELDRLGVAELRTTDAVRREWTARPCDTHPYLAIADHGAAHGARRYTVHAYPAYPGMIADLRMRGIPATPGHDSHHADGSVYRWCGPHAAAHAWHTSPAPAP